jgi:hypothetical protein
LFLQRPGYLVGERDSRDFCWAATHQLLQSRLASTVALGVADHRYDADHQHLPQIAVTGFGDAAETLLTAA